MYPKDKELLKEKELYESQDRQISKTIKQQKKKYNIE